MVLDSSMCMSPSGVGLRLRDVPSFVCGSTGPHAVACSFLTPCPGAAVGQRPSVWSSGECLCLGVKEDFQGSLHRSVLPSPKACLVMEHGGPVGEGEETVWGHTCVILRGLREQRERERGCVYVCLRGGVVAAAAAAV